ncbi:MAG: acetyl-CoA carboxylase biotin carboxyl carrier protein subunit [Myxococcaceae bacterium]
MKLIAKIDDQDYAVQVELISGQENLYLIKIDDREYRVDAHMMLSEIVTTIIDGKSYDIDIEQQNISDPLDGRLGVRVRGRVVYLEMLEERRQKMKDASMARFSESGLVRICSPMPGKVLRNLVSPGDLVTEGQGLAVVEAMKMENELKSPKNAQVKDVFFKPGDSVEGGALLLTIEV